jgi:transposase
MRRYNEATDKSKWLGVALFVGIDLHRTSWHVTVRTESTEVFSGSIPGRWESLVLQLERYPGAEFYVVYEAGYFGFWLHDLLEDHGARCTVTPPSLIPQEYGNRVKTDSRDSRKLAELLAKGMLKRVWVPSAQERNHRQVIRRRRQLIGDRVRTQNRIKALLRFHGIELAEPRGRWSKRYVENLRRLRWSDPCMQATFGQMLDTYEFFSTGIEQQTTLVKELSESELYRERVRILRTMPRMGVLSAMEILLELQDVSRFRDAKQLAAYVGLTPSQYSSAEKVRMGRITGIGKNSVRSTLVEVAWQLIGKDGALRQRYDQLKVRSGAKRAIVAIARILLLRIRRMLLDGTAYRGALVR